MTIPEEEPLRFSNERKLRKQMRKRGWTETEIREALRTPPVRTSSKRGAALRYIHPETGRSVVVDETSGEIFHVGGDGYEY